MIKAVIKNTSLEEKECFGDVEGVNTEFAATSEGELIIYSKSDDVTSFVVLNKREFDNLKHFLKELKTE